MKMWTEMRTAMMVARLGSVRAAATALGVHRATVTRHVDALETALGTKLFLRHREGYTLTTEGAALRHLADSTDRLMDTFLREAKEHHAATSGTLTISSLVRVAPVVAPLIETFCAAHPGARVEFLAEPGLTRLELGQADIAFRIGAQPTDPDYVVRPFRTYPLGLFAHRRYLDARGVPTGPNDLGGHHFVGIKSAFGTVDVVELFGVPTEAVRFLTNEPTIAEAAVEAGIGLGVLPRGEIDRTEGLVEVLPTPTPPEARVWLVTHVDLHRTRMVQAFFEHVRRYDRP
ncbi:MAG: LysR family transcriptional regulator [Pseudomonadota bacterium]